MMIYDPVSCLEEYTKGCVKLSQLIVGANTLIQAAVPAVLDPEAGSEAESALAEHKVGSGRWEVGGGRWEVGGGRWEVGGGDSGWTGVTQ
jgi:hypothetical protein